MITSHLAARSSQLAPRSSDILAPRTSHLAPRTFDANSSLARTASLLMLGCIGAMGCGVSEETPVEEVAMQSAPSQDTSQATSDEGRRSDPAGRPSVLVRWGIRPSDDAEIVSGFLNVEIENDAEDAVTVDLGLRGFGLDQRVVWVPLGQFSLAAKETLHTQVALGDLPVQSIGTPGQIDLTGSSSGPDWTDARLATDSVYVQFVPGFERAYVSTRSTWAPVALGLADQHEELAQAYYKLRDEPVSVLPSDGQSVSGEVDTARARLLYQEVVVPTIHPRGRYIDDGRMVEVRGDVVGSGGLPVESRQEDLMAALGPYGEHNGTEPPIGRASGKICAKYGVEYLDSGVGENVMPYWGFQTYPARYAAAEVRTPNHTSMWSGYLDFNGCASNVSLPIGDYVLVLNNEQKDPTSGVRFLHFTDNWVSYERMTVSFSVTSALPFSKSLTTSNQRASRTQAVVAALFAMTDPGLTANKTYRFLLSDLDCGGSGAYSDVTHICLGYNQGYPNPSGPHNTQWKVIIAHEIGHSVERDGAGLANGNYDHVVPTSLPLCRCDHVPFSGHRAHCLQSREYTRAAWEEGFAHFYAAKIFNDAQYYPQYTGCVISYYKSVLDPNIIFRGPVMRSPPITLSCRDAVKWRKTYCYDPNDDNAGTEWDWLTFFWNIHWPDADYASQKRISMADYYEIKRRACTGSPSGMCTNAHVIKYSDFRTAAWAKYCGPGIVCGSFRYNHIHAMAGAHGVDQ